MESWYTTVKKPVGKTKLFTMRNKIITIAVLTLLAGTALWFKSHQAIPKDLEITTTPINRPLPVLSTATKRRQSYEPVRGDVKYRVVPKPLLGTDFKTGWNTYTSKEYNFSFTYPKTTHLDTTEGLGYQLPPADAIHGSRDTFQIEISNPKSAFFLLFMNDKNATLPPATTTSQTILNANGISMQKKIMQSTEEKFASSEIIVYTFEKNNKLFMWYGTFDAQDFASINEFESVVASTIFTK